MTPAEQKDAHESRRAEAARASYLTWRMADVPAVYQNLMPFSFDALTLWKAEKAIRAQMDEDQKLIASPWRRLGPPSAILNTDSMSALEKIEFSLEAGIPIGMEDQPKRGGVFDKDRSDDPSLPEKYRDYEGWKRKEAERRRAENEGGNKAE